jgi:uncharacterized protein YjbJ (UPF0337 family)
MGWIDIERWPRSTPRSPAPRHEAATEWDKSARISRILFSGRFVMNWDQIAGDWKQLAGKVKEKWGKLTDNDLTTIAGKRDQLAGLLQERYGYAKDQAEKELDAFEHTLRS